jgi:hypothetical protein
MPGQHRYPRRYFRPEPTLYERAKAILSARESNVNDYLEQCLRDLADGQAGEPPQRPEDGDGASVEASWDCCDCCGPTCPGRHKGRCLDGCDDDD